MIVNATIMSMSMMNLMWLEVMMTYQQNVI